MKPSSSSNTVASPIPSHIAIIMDGNRRWARDRHLPQIVGHEFGRRRLEPLIRQAARLGIKFLTFWAFSTENWKRTEEEKEAIFNIVRKFGKEVLPKLVKNGVQLRVIGELERFPEDVQQIFQKLIEETRHNSRVIVNLALSYGGRSEILRAVKKVLEQKITSEQLSEETFSQFLDTRGEPDPELMIRTGGVQRTSGYLPWQTAYSELYFTQTLWPDFGPPELKKAIEWYRQQKRSFGQ